MLKHRCVILNVHKQAQFIHYLKYITSFSYIFYHLHIVLIIHITIYNVQKPNIKSKIYLSTIKIKTYALEILHFNSILPILFCYQFRFYSFAILILPLHLFSFQVILHYLHFHLHFYCLLFLILQIPSKPHF